MPLRKIEVWVDRKKQVQQFAGAFFSNYGFLNASLPLAAGSHRVSVIAYGWDNSQLSKRIHDHRKGIIILQRSVFCRSPHLQLRPAAPASARPFR